MEIIRNRTLRPSSRKPSSTYKIDVSNISSTDKLIINIYHEKSTSELLYRYTISGKDLIGKNSIHFKALENDGSCSIKWYAVKCKDIT